MFKVNNRNTRTQKKMQQWKGLKENDMFLCNI